MLMTRRNNRESYGSETSFPITRDGIAKSFGLYHKLCSERILRLNSRLTKKQIDALLATGTLLKDNSKPDMSLAEIILEQMEGYEWLMQKSFPEGILRKYSWSRAKLEKIVIGIDDYRIKQDLSLDDFRIYARSIKDHPIYSTESQMQLGRMMRRGDIEARDKLVISHLRFVARNAFAMHRAYKNISVMQFIEWGNETLLDATKTYDPEIGSFTSYIRTILRRELCDRTNEFKKNMRFKDKIFFRVWKMKQAVNLFMSECGREPTVDELVHRMDYRESAVRRIYRVYQIEKMPQRDAYESGLSTSSVAHSEFEKKELKELVDKVLFYVGPTKERILKLLYGIDCEVHTMRQAAKIVGLSYGRVDQLHQEALRQIKANPRAYRQVESYLAHA
jgi:RNA polymerase sigma factor (sigma-70 family)